MSIGSPIRHVGLQSDIAVSDGSPIRHLGPRWVYDENNIFVKSRKNCVIWLKNTVFGLYSRRKYVYGKDLVCFVC